MGTREFARSRPPGKLEARLRPLKECENKTLRDLMQRRCASSGIPYDQPSPDPQHVFGKATPTEILRAQFHRPLADGEPPSYPGLPILAHIVLLPEKFYGVRQLLLSPFV